jgi:hypothetical protein
MGSPFFINKLDYLNLNVQECCITMYKCFYLNPSELIMNLKSTFKTKLSFIFVTLCAISQLVTAQTNEYFETSTVGAKSFTSNSQGFTLTNALKITSLTSAGVDANTPASTSGSSSKYIDNLGAGAKNQVNSIKTTNAALFTLKKLYFYVSTVDNNANTPSSDGSITFVGKKAGNVQFTRTITTGFNTSFSPYSGFNVLDLTTGTDHSNINIDEIEFTLGGNFVYVAIDNFTFDAPVLATPSLSTTGTLTAFSTCANIASASQSITVSGADLTANLEVNAPTGFEVSLSSGNGYSSSLSITPNSGAVSATLVYVRLAAGVQSSPSGNVTISSTGATSKTIAASGQIKYVPSITSVTGATRCDAGTVLLQAAAAKAQAPASPSINWYDVPTNGTVLTTAATYSPNVTSTKSFYVEATFNGCTSTSRTEVVATVNTTPPMPEPISDSVCGHGVMTLSSAAPGRSAGVPIVYNWYDVPVNGTSLASTFDFTTPDLNISTTYYVSVTFNGCTSARAAVEAKVKMIPMAPQSGYVQRCGEGVFTLVANMPIIRTTKTGEFHFEWYDSFTLGNLVSTNDTLITGVITSGVQYYVASVLDGCTSDRALIGGYVDEIPLNPTVTDGYSCGEGTVLLEALSAQVRANKMNCRGNCISQIGYNWYQDDVSNTVVGTGAQFTTPVLTESTTYYVEAESEQGCKSNRVAVMAEVRNLNMGVTVSATTLESDHGKGASHQWINCADNSVIDGETNRSFTPTVSGDYAVIVTANGCTDTSACYSVSIVTGLEASLSNHIAVYPNPASDIIHVTLEANAVGTLAIVDLHGNVVASKSVSGKQLSVSTSEIANGVYVLKVSTDLTTFTKQISVVK